MNKLIILFSFTFFSFSQEKYTKSQKNLSSNFTICTCLETEDSELTDMSPQEFDWRCTKLFKDLGLSNVLKATKNCDLDKISKILYEDIGHEIISLDELNTTIAKFFHIWNTD